MKKILFIVLVGLGAIAPVFGSDGFWVSHKAFKEDYVIYSPPHPGRIQDYITSVNLSMKERAPELAGAILASSACLSLDPIYLTSKIHRESSFYPEAVSPTGAVGLSQMTSIGIKEIQDQLGMKGARYARSSNSLFLLQSLQDCMGFEGYMDFYEAFDQPIRDIKKNLKQSPRTSIYAGAVLLKVYLAKARDAYPAVSKPELYRIALEQYNGEPTKAAYARWIKGKVDLFNRKY